MVADLTPHSHDDARHAVGRGDLANSQDRVQEGASLKESHSARRVVQLSDLRAASRRRVKRVTIQRLRAVWAGERVVLELLARRRKVPAFPPGLQGTANLDYFFGEDVASKGNVVRRDAPFHAGHEPSMR